MKHRNKCTIILRFSYIDTPPLLCYAELLLNPPKKTMSSYQLGKVGKHCITLPLDTMYIYSIVEGFIRRGQCQTASQS